MILLSASDVINSTDVQAASENARSDMPQHRLLIIDRFAFVNMMYAIPS